MFNYTWLPLALTVLRLLLAPLVLALAAWQPLPAAFGACLAAALLSDVFDGVLARRLGQASASLRRLDSLADSVFYGACLWAIWRLQPQVLRSHTLPLLLLLGLEALRYAYDWLRFRREASYHTWSAKLWGLLLFLACWWVLVRGADGWPVGAALFIGIAADVEGLLISALLPCWRHDVPTLVHALRLRGDGACGDAEPSLPRSG